MDCASGSDTSQNRSNMLRTENPATAVSVEKLQNAVDKSVKRMTSMSRVLPYFKEHFRQVYQVDSKNVLEFYKSMMSQLKSMMKEELQMQLDASNVEELLCSLDKIKAEVKTWNSQQRHWRPSGDPKEDIKAHLQDSSRWELQQLEKILDTLESQNKLLNECVTKSDEQLQKSLKRIEDQCSTWREAASTMSDETRQSLIDVNMNLPNETQFT